MNDQRIPVRLEHLSGKKYRLAHDPSARSLLRAALRLQAGPADIPAMDESRRIIEQAAGMFDAHTVLMRGLHAADDMDGLARAQASCMAEDVPLFWDFPDDGVLEWKTAANQPFLRCLLQGAMISAARGHLKVAARDFRRIIQLDPADEQGSAALLLACLFGLEEWGEAERLSQERLSGPEMRWGLGLALAAQGRMSEAGEAIAQAAKKHPAEGRALLSGVGESEPASLQRFALVFGGYWQENREALKLLAEAAGTSLEPKKKRTKGSAL